MERFSEDIDVIRPNNIVQHLLTQECKGYEWIFPVSHEEKLYPKSKKCKESPDCIFIFNSFTHDHC